MTNKVVDMMSRRAHQTFGDGVARVFDAHYLFSIDNLDMLKYFERRLRGWHNEDEFVRLMRRLMRRRTSGTDSWHAISINYIVRVYRTLEMNAVEFSDGEIELMNTLVELYTDDIVRM